jgi:hypothetical protein
MGLAIARLKGVDARLRGLWTGVNALKAQPILRTRSIDVAGDGERSLDAVNQREARPNLRQRTRRHAL